MIPCRLPHLLRRLDWPEDAQSIKALSIGLASRFTSALWGDNQVGPHLARAISAIDHNQAEFYFDSTGQIVGFAAWTFVGGEASQDLIHSGASALPSAVQCDGDQLWITDLFAYHGILPKVLADLRDRRLARYDTATYFRVKGGSHIVKQLSRTDKTTFFRKRLDRNGRGPQQEDDVMLTTDERTLIGAEQTLTRALEIGRCLLALWNSGQAEQSPLWRSFYMLTEIVAIRQFRTYLAPNNGSDGLLTWAWLSERTIARVEHTPLHAVHTSEWNEGATLCLCDVVMTDAVSKDMLEDIRGNLFPAEMTMLLYWPPRRGAQGRLSRVSRERPEEIDEWLMYVSGTGFAGAGPEQYSGETSKDFR